MEARRTVQALSAFLLLASCGPCGVETIRHIDLRTVSQSQLIQDEKLFKRDLEREGPFLIALALSEVARHPREAHIFERFGYIRLFRRSFVMTKLGLSESSQRSPGKYMFVLAKKSSDLGMAHFKWETEEIACNEGHEHLRIYGWDRPIGPLTPLGSALFENKSLYIGSAAPGHEEHPHIWRNQKELLHSYFEFDPDFRVPVLNDGETIDFQWSDEFSGL